MVRSIFLSLIITVLIATARCGSNVWEIVVGSQDTDADRYAFHIVPFYQLNTRTIEPLGVRLTNIQESDPSMYDLMVENRSTGLRVLNTGRKKMLLQPGQVVRLPTLDSNNRMILSTDAARLGRDYALHGDLGFALYEDLIARLRDEILRREDKLPLDLDYNRNWFYQRPINGNLAERVRIAHEKDKTVARHYEKILEDEAILRIKEIPNTPLHVNSDPQPKEVEKKNL
ncbi:hypothetical protein MJO28_016605 [Puccinia striiformis f. sp. tritici]|uniref:Uncharacterized protein n=3 Tax=Puccinia striiformis TaxID=27350 RepID=A0A2S4VAD3_9BASI|nr:hypothetical protein Pst134EB_030854 [Puccinia striiformis f. sp. tritici]KAI7935734.1 hypothetical protein MJO28_016605 [Puccinia striiformis f. sp. tritici]KAI9601923.1 hypothetical protein KEM48_001211 [Puccinia striiformis f. sp. tritici PST-130]POW06425.1 hypothetical protein PSHT_10366 [Puccinia striiformis]POW16035.1 hypothetical protein PSTT_01554 [Puccinia striiformis]